MKQENQVKQLTCEWSRKAQRRYRIGQKASSILTILLILILNTGRAIAADPSPLLTITFSEKPITLTPEEAIGAADPALFAPKYAENYIDLKGSAIPIPDVYGEKATVSWGGDGNFLKNNEKAGPNLLQGFLGTEGKSSVRFDNLKAGTYKLYIYSQAAENAVATQFNVNGKDLGVLKTDVGREKYEEKGNYFTTSVIVSDKDSYANAIIIDYRSAKSGVSSIASVVPSPLPYGVLNAIQIADPNLSPVPEPASVVMLGIGGIAVAVRLRKKEAID